MQFPRSGHGHYRARVCISGGEEPLRRGCRLRCRSSIVISLRYRGDVMERRAFRLSGFVMLAGLSALVVVHVLVSPRVAGSTTQTLLLVFLVDLPFVLIATGLTVVNPNEARVVQFFGRYIGSVRDAGFWWT